MLNYVTYIICIENYVHIFYWFISPHKVIGFLDHNHKDVSRQIDKLISIVY